MARLTKLYTRTGDGGLTRLGAGTEVAKDSLRVRAYGTVDELNSCIGVAIAVGLCERLSVELTAIPESENPEFDVPRIGTEQVNKLEVLIDELTEVVGPLENFILPGGSPGAAALHVARTVCRRAERRVVSLAREENVVMARFENREAGVEEPLWQPGH